MHPLARAALAEARRAWPYALVLAAALGAVVVAGANLSNAFPSQSRPYGWPGPSSFENGVAMVRPDLVLAATLPALALGATALRDRDARASALPLAFGVDALLLSLGALLAGAIGAVGTSRATPLAFEAFVAAHALLAIAFYALAFLAAAIARAWAWPIAIAAWLGFVSLFDHVTQTVLFRQMGYDNLTSGNFPAWFFVAQACSPLAAYRGVLILWDRRFMDYVENAALGKATLPAWANPGTFAAFMLLAWILLPLALACLAWWSRARWSQAPALARRDEEAA